MKAALVRIHGLLVGQLGVDPLRLARSARALPRFLGDLVRFRAMYKGPLRITPSLHEWYEEAGSTRTEYFWQDLLVARWVALARPERHVDVGSRIDGFVAHVASFRDIEVLDVRPISTVIPGVRFRQADLMNPIDDLLGYCDSLSCLHALEHFGLGRYGDPLDPRGFERGLSSMARLLRPSGVFYLSVPIGAARVEFNSHRVLDPQIVIEVGRANGLRLRKIAVIKHGHHVSEHLPDEEGLSMSLAGDALGIFVFERVGDREI